MANEGRIPGHHGWKPRDPGQPVPFLEDHLLAAAAFRSAAGTPAPTPLPMVPVTEDVDRETLVPAWPMYLNGPDPSNPPYAPDGLGDCTVAEAAHAFSAMCVYSGQPFPAFTLDAITTAYSAVGGYVRGDPSTDNGADMVTVCKYMTSTGLPDDTGKVHRYYAWAAFKDPGNLPLMAQVLNAGGTVVCASWLQQSQEDQFSNGEPWAWVPGEQPIGGHAYPLQRRRYGGTGILEFITWGEVQHARRQFWWNASRVGQAEAYMVVSEDFIRANGTTLLGMPLDQLAADCADV